MRFGRRRRPCAPGLLRAPAGRRCLAGWHLSHRGVQYACDAYTHFWNARISVDHELVGRVEKQPNQSHHARKAVLSRVDGRNGLKMGGFGWVRAFGPPDLWC
jgi:hypothetical protein